MQGGAASLVPIPQELLESASIRQRYPGTGTSNGGSVNNSRVEERRSTRTQIPYEVPEHVNRLLQSIGIDDADVPIDLVAGPPHMRSDRTAKLVGHIFECLDALQHLVRSNQNDITAETASETQSMADMNTRSVGRLLHEMISICSLSGDTVKALVRANPEAAGIEDNFGRMPIHVACDREDPWIDVLEAIVEANPEALSRRDGGGRLPLHVALDRQRPVLEVVQLLVKWYPAAAGARRGVGRLPIHYACFAEQIDVELLYCLYEAFPEGVRATDVYGRLPLHYAVDKAVPNPDIVAFLLDAFPQGASMKDSQQRIPLAILVDREKVDMRVLLALHRVSPEGVRQKGFNGRLPLHIAVESPYPSESAIFFLATAYPQGVYASTDASSMGGGGGAGGGAGGGGGSGSTGGMNGASVSGTASQSQSSRGALSGAVTPLQIALVRNLHAAARMMVLARGHGAARPDPYLLRTLHWVARRPGLLATLKGSPNPAKDKALHDTGNNSNSTSTTEKEVSAPAALHAAAASGGGGKGTACSNDTITTATADDTNTTSTTLPATALKAAGAASAMPTAENVAANRNSRRLMGPSPTYSVDTEYGPHSPPSSRPRTRTGSIAENTTSSSSSTHAQTSSTQAPPTATTSSAGTTGTTTATTTATAVLAAGGNLPAVISTERAASNSFRAVHGVLSQSRSSSVRAAVLGSRESSMRQRAATLLSSAQGTPAVSLRRANIQSIPNDPSQYSTIPSSTATAATTTATDSSSVGAERANAANVNRSSISHAARSNGTTTTTTTTASEESAINKSSSLGRQVSTVAAVNHRKYGEVSQRIAAARKELEENDDDDLAVKINLLHLLHKTNTDLWRHVISFL